MMEAELSYVATNNECPDAVKQLLVDTATPMPGYDEYAIGAGYVNAYAATQLASSIKKVKTHKDKHGQTIDVYVVEQTLAGTAGPAVASYNKVASTHNHPFGLTAGAVFLDVKLIWDNRAQRPGSVPLRSKR